MNLLYVMLEVWVSLIRSGSKPFAGRWRIISLETLFCHKYAFASVTKFWYGVTLYEVKRLLPTKSVATSPSLPRITSYTEAKDDSKGFLAYNIIWLLKEVIFHTSPNIWTEITEVAIPLPGPDEIVIEVVVAVSNVKGKRNYFATYSWGSSSARFPFSRVASSQDFENISQQWRRYRWHCP